ncbi:MAG: WecB/TagA/CpsF family glycosyltransferase [Bacillota bacterium]
MNERVRVFGISVDRVDMKGALQLIEEFIREGSPHLIFAANPEKVMRVEQDGELKEILQQAHLVIADGTGIVWAAKVFGRSLPERVTGIDLMHAITALSASRGYRVYFLGAAPGVAEEASTRLARIYPGLQVAGTHHGYFRPEEEAELIQEVNFCRPDVLFVAMGSPRQEKWLHRHREQLEVPVCMGIGGSLDVITGRVDRAPRWMQQVGLEWSYRLLRDPRRVVRMTVLPRYALRVAMARLTGSAKQ